MKKIYLFLLLCCLNLAAFGTTVTIFSAGSSGTYTTGYVLGVAASLTRTDGNITIEAYRTTSTTAPKDFGYMVFDLSAIAKGSTINSVTLGYYIQGYTASTAGTAYYITGFPGDLSKFTDVQSLNNAVRFNKTGTGGTMLKTILGSSGGLGTATGHMYQVLDGYLANSWFSQYAGGKASICLSELGTTSSARIYTISGEAGSGGSDSTTTNHIPYLTIDYTDPSSSCSGAPATANAAASPRAGTSATGFVLELSGSTIATGLTYQWKSSTSFGGTYTNISGATSPTWTFTGVSAKTYYACDITCAASSTTTTSNIDSIDVIAASSCTPSYSNKYYADYGGTVIGGMTLGIPSMTGDGTGPSLADSTKPNAIAYLDATGSYNLPAVRLNKTYTHTFNFRTGTYGQYLNAWIDFNNNGTFETSEFQGSNYTASSGSTNYTASFSAIPATVSSGYRRMRIVSSYYGSGITTAIPPCPPTGTSLTYGETRDYLVNIQDPPPAASATPSSLSFTATTAGTTSGTLTTSLSGLYLLPSSGSLTVTAPSNYDVSPDGSTWYSTSYSASYTSATYSGTIYVRFNAPSTAATYTGNVSVTGGGLAAALNIPVSAISAAICSGTPTAGTASASTGGGASTTAVTLSVTGYTASGGITFQWQSATSASGTFTNISGATNPTYSYTGISSTLYYQCVVGCSATSTSATTNAIAVYYIAPSSCTPVWYYTTACSNGMTIGNTTNHFKIAGATSTLDDGNACSGGYVDNSTSSSSSMTTTMNAGSSYSCSFGDTYAYNMNYQVWIDFNNNGTFESSETVGGISTTSSTIPTCTLTIPSGTAGVTPGVFRMRVESEYYYHHYPSMLPCPNSSSTSNYYGEVRDYKVTITVPPVGSVTPSSLAFSPTVSGTSSTALTSALSGSFLSPSSGSLTVTAPSGFEVYDPGSSSWVSSYTVSYSAATYSATLQVRFSPSSVGSYSGNVTVTGGGLSTLNIAVTGTGATACSGTPTAGTATTSPSAGGTTTAFALSLTGYTSAGGLTFQWQSSSSATGTFTNISGATNINYSFTGVSATTYYQCVVTCSFSSSSATSSVVTVRYYPPSSCTPTWYYSTACSYGMTVATTTYPFKINGASGTALNDATACSGGYVDNSSSASSSMTVTLNAGTTYVATAGETYGYNMSYQVWIDFNGNGTFESTESVGGIANTSSYTPTFNLVIPAGSSSITPGVYRMRVESEYYYHRYPSMLPCPNGSATTNYYGEVRDYKITLNVPPVVAITPTTMPFPPTVPSGGSYTTLSSSITASFLSPSTGSLTVTSPSSSFEVSPDGSTWASSYTIGYTGGATTGTIYVRFVPAAVTSYSGNVTITGGSTTGLAIAVTGTGAAACSGTPTAGTASVSPAAGAGSTAFTLTNTGYTASGGISFQWQSSADSSSWSNISGATLASYSFTGISATTYYRCNVTCSFSSTTVGTYSTKAYYFPSSSCTPRFYYAPSSLGSTIGTSTSPFRMVGFSGSINDASTASSTGYTDQSATMGCTVNAGTTYTATTGSSASYSLDVQAWIDFNSDGAFQSTEVVGGAAATAAATHPFNIVMPAGDGAHQPGVYRMRVATEYYYHHYPNLLACPNTSTSSSYYGEVRDYYIVYNVPPAVVITPTSMAFPPTTTGTSSSTMISTYAATFLSPASGTLTVTAPSGYEVYNGSSWVSSYTISYTGAANSGSISVRFSPTAVATYTGNVSISGGGLSSAVSNLNIAVSGTGAAACSGTPTAGTSTVSPTAASSGTTTVSLSVAGYSATGGIQFQWQFTGDTTTAWNDISGGTTAAFTYTVSLTSSMYYRCKVICPYSSSNASTYAVKVTYITASSCTPSYTYGTSSVAATVGYSARPFTLVGDYGTSLVDADAPSTGYANKLSGSYTCTLTAGSTYTATCGNSYGYSINHQMWIDFNNDGTFQSTESVGGIATSSSYTPTFSVVVPAGTAGVSAGVYRMRIEAEYYYHRYPSMLACPNGSASSCYYGEARDYRITVVVPPTGTRTPTSLSFSPTVISTSSASQTSIFSGLFLTPTSGTLTVTAPAGFDVSNNGTTWGSSYTISYTGATSTSNTIYVRFSPTSAISYSGNVTITGGGLSGQNIAVTGTGAAICSTTPSAGTAAVSPTTGASGTTFNLSLSGVTVAGGLTYQWESSPTGTGSWTAITGATNSTYSVAGISSTTYYHCIVTCPYGGSAATSGNATATWVMPSSTCTPSFYYASASCSSYGGFLANSSVHLKIIGSTGSIDDGNACTGTGYSDYSSSLSCTLLLANSYTMSVAGSSLGQTYQAWIDFNSNGAFESSETVGGIASSSTAVSATSFTVTLPSGAGYNAGTYRMRVMGYYYYYGTYPTLNPCPNSGTSPYYYYGEVRDYKVIVNAPPPFASATPTSLSFGTIGASTTSSALSFSLSGFYLTPSSGTLTVTAPTNYLVCNSATGTFSSSYTISYGGGSTTSNTVYVKFAAPSTAGTYAANVAITGGGLSSAYNVAVTGNSAYPCTGTPTAGTLSASPSAGLSTTTFAMTLSGATVGLGMLYQWQSSTSGASGSFSDITGATNVTYNPTGLTTNTYFQCIVTCAYSGISATSNVINTPIYCLPDYYYGGCSLGAVVATAANHLRLNGVSGTSLNDGTSCTTASDYVDNYGTMSVTLNAGTTYVMTTGNSYGYSMNYQAWIDFNNDGVFQSTETLGGVSTVSTTVTTFNVVIPAGSAAIAPGTYRLRVEGEYYYHHYPTMNPCPDGTTANQFYYGEVRDYKVVLNVPPVSSVGTTSMAFPATTVSTSSAPISTTFTGSYLTPASGSITVTAPGNFQVYDPGSSSWVSSYTVSYSGSSYTGTIQVQFNPTAVTSYSGNVTISGGGLSTTTIAVTGNGAPLCSGTPTAGTASVSPTSGNASTAFTLSLSGYTALGGITFQWQSSPDSSSWTNISGATLASYSFTGITSNVYYRCNVTCTPSSSSVSTYATIARFFPASSCTPAWYYASNACSTYGMVVASASNPFRVSGASGTSINDATACTGSGYLDQTASYGVTLVAGSTYTFTTGATYGSTMNNQVWIDFNNNGTFESSESVGGRASFGGVTTFNVTLPAASASITPGVYRMRVEAEYNYHTYPSMNPCPDGTTTNSFYYGEVRDYKVTLNCPPSYTLSPTSIAFPPTTTGTSSAGVTAAFAGLYLTPSSGSMTVVAPANFDVYDPGSSSWVSSYTVSYTGGTAPMSVQVRFSPTSVTSYSGNVAISGGGISTANIAVTGTGAAACSGTPTAGTASASPSSGSASTAFTLSVTGYTATGGIQFQWQQSNDSTSWSDITGATLATYSFTGVTANKYFRCNVTCPYSSSTTATYATLVRFFPASSCTPAFYYASNACGTYGMVVASATNHFFVNGASGTTINDGTACTGTGYLDQTASYGCTLNAGTTYVFTTGATYGSTMNNQVWIDFNNNGTFESTETVGGRASFGGVTTFNVVIPSGSSSIQPGIYRMRVIAEYNYHSYPSMNPCPDGTTANQFYYGEVRDYKITLNVPPVGAVSPTSLTFPTTTIANYSAPLTSNLTASYLSPASGNLTVTAPSGYFFYIGGSYVTSYTIAYSGSVVTSTPINVYFYPTSATSYTGNVTVTGGGLTTLNIAVTGTGSSSCTSTPSAGTAVATPSTASPATSVTLSLTGTTVAGGLTYQWQSSSTSGGTYTAITGATNPTYTFTGLAATTYYNCVVTCPYGGTASTSSYATVNWTLPTPSCTPNSTYSSCGVSGISSLTIPGSSGSISDGNYCTGVYQDRTTYSCTMYLGYTYSSTLNFSSTSYGQDVQYWIDFNSDGVFQTSETVGGANLSASSSGTANITIPSSVTPATYRMRMITVYNAYSYHYPTLDPCLSGVFYGECRDYKVIISNPPPTVTRTPASLAFGSVTTGTTSSALSFNVSGSYLLPTSGTITITAPSAQFGVSNSASGGFASSYTITYTGGTIPSTPVYVNFSPSASTSYSGNVAITGGGLSTAVNVAVTGTGAAACSTTPTAGTATTSPSSGSTTTSFTLGLSGATAAGGLTYQWQSSLTGTSGSFTNITGATTATYTFTGISANTYYQCVVGCSFGGSTATSTTVMQTYALPAASCTPAPTYAYNACYSYTMNFTTVNLVGLSGSISDNAACDGSGYKDRTTLSCTLLAGSTYTLSESFTTGTSSYSDYSQWWIDFNNDGTFQTSESVGGNTTAFNTGTVTLTIPSTGISAGTYRMRGVCDYNGSGHVYPSMSPCMTGYNYGEARDYKVIIVVPTACSGTPTAGSISATATSGCAPVSSTLSLPGTAGVTGLGYQWYSSATGAGGSFSAISGATNSTYASVSTASSSVTPTYYNCVVTCLSSSASATSSTQSISATPSPGSITGGSTACVGGTTSLSNSLSGGTWSSSATGIATVNPTTGVVTGNSVGSCTISYTTSGCSPATSSFTVNGSPAAITGFTGICVGGTSTLSDATTGGTWSSSNTSVASVNSSTGAVYAVGSGSATISYGAGCGTPATFSWTTATTPTAITGPTSICVSTTGTFSNAVSGGTWSNSPSTYGTIDASTGVFTASSSVGTSTITYTLGYCSVTGTATVANTSPGAISGTLSACAGGTSTLTDASSGGAWSSSNTAVATINSGGVVTGVSSGTSTITYSTGCGTDATATFTVNGSPVSISSTTACSQSTLNMTANVGAGTYTYSWSGPGGFTSTVQSPAISSASTSRSGIYSVTATQSGCSVSTSAWVSVDTTPVVSLTASPSSICPGSTSTLSAAVTSPAAGSSNYAVYAIPYAPFTLTTVSSGPSGVNGNSTVSMPFSFNFYGTSYNSVTISTNGYINFGTPSTSWTVVSLPSSSAPLGMIAPFWHYMNAGSGTIKYATLGTAPNRKFVVRFSGVSDYSGTGTNSAQVVLYETSNMIEMFVSQANTTGTYSGVCGIQNVSGNAAATVPGQNNVNYSINNTTAGTGWRFVNPSYSYTWSPATGLSSTSITSPVASGLTSSQTYTVTSIDANSGCTTGNVSSTTVTLYTLPTAYALSPANGCTGVTHITIPSSETTATYQLYRGGTAVGSPVTGTGSALDFGTQSVTGTYSVVATLASGGCTTNMTGTTVITASPVVYALTGGNGCTGTGVTIGISNSESAVNYQLWNSGSTVGSSVSGSTGSPISFGSQTAAGTYTAIATAVTGGCQSTMSGSSVITTAPTAYAVGGGTGCSATGVTVTLPNSETGVSYQLKRDGSAVGSPTAGSTGSALSFGLQTTPGTYTIEATGSASCTTTMTGSAVVNQTPGITLGANPSVCQPLTSTSITYSSPIGSPTSYSITWGSSAITDGFSNVTGATLTGGSIALNIPSTSVSGVYTGTISVSNGSCGSSSYSFTLTVYAVPNASISSVTAPCMGYATTIAFTGTAGADVDYTIDGGSTLTGTLTGGSYSFSSGAMTSAHTYVLVNAHNPVCTTAVAATVTVTPTPMEWTGATSSDWNDAANWTCGFVPGSSDDAAITATFINAPSIAASASGTTRNLSVNAAATVTVNSSAVLHVQGNLTNNGTVTGAGVLSMDGAGAQTVSGTGSVAKFDVNNTSGVTVNTGALLTVKNVLSVTSGSLATGDSVVLYSDTTVNARVATLPSGSSITGKVQVQQFISAGRRAYRFWATPFSNSIALNQLTNKIDITGAGGATNGFTPTATNAPSAYRYNPLVGNSSLPGDPGWRPFTSANSSSDTNALTQYQGIRFYYRGAKGEGLGYGPYIVISHTTIMQTGNLNQGAQNVTLAKGSSTSQDYNMVGNPYASPVDIGTVIYNAANAGRINGSRFYIWNPFLGTAGQFQSIQYSTCDCSSGGTAIPYYIQANNAFQVRAANNGDQLNFAESNKGSSYTATYSLMKTSSDVVSLGVYDANYHPYDMLDVRFDDAATADEDSRFDAGKPSGAEFNFYSLSTDNHMLALDARPYKANSTIQLGVNSAYAQDFIIRAEQLALPTGGKVYLHDKLLKQYVLLQQGTEYRFSVTKDNNTQGNNRFELSMEPQEVASIQAAKGLEVTMTPNPANDEVKVNFTSGKKDEVKVRVLDLSGVSVYNQDLGMKQSGTIMVPLSSLASGIYMVELTSGDQKVVQRLIKE